jgi:hypothetical protein
MKRDRLGSIRTSFRDLNIWLYFAQRPNKAPEPTPTSVTPRAFLPSVFDRFIAARGAPAAVVAHL